MPTPTRVAAAAAGVLALTGGLLAQPASAAVFTIDTDSINMARTHVDFGRAPHIGGFPTQNATMTWSVDTVTDKITGKLTGQLFYDDVLNDGCGRVRVTFQTAGGTALPGGTLYSATACRSAGVGLLVTRSVSSTFSHTNLGRASVQLQWNDSPNGLGTWHNDGVSKAMIPGGN